MPALDKDPAIWQSWIVDTLLINTFIAKILNLNCRFYLEQHNDTIVAGVFIIGMIINFCFLSIFDRNSLLEYFIRYPVVEDKAKQCVRLISVDRVRANQCDLTLETGTDRTLSCIKP